MNPNQTPSSTPERHRTARRHEQRPQEMPTPQHRRVPAQPSTNDDPFVADAPVAGGTLNTTVNPSIDLAQLQAHTDHMPAQSSHGDPFAADVPVAGGTWQATVDPSINLA
jgi:hypothetical protein